MVDTNSDPGVVDFAIPANDDASKSIALITSIICKAIEEGLGERKAEKEKEAVTQKAAKAKAADQDENKPAKKTPSRKTHAKKVDIKEVTSGQKE